MIILYACLFTAIFTYTAIWLWYIKAYMQYDFYAPFRRRLDYELLSDEDLADICDTVIIDKQARCRTILKMMFVAGPFAWIVILVVLLVGKLVLKIDKNYEATGTTLL